MRSPLAGLAPHPPQRAAVVLHSWTSGDEKWELKARVSAADLVVRLKVLCLGVGGYGVRVSLQGLKV